ncbi:MAG TPA: ATP-binding protein, partial [Methylobacterium sp.]
VPLPSAAPADLQELVFAPVPLALRIGPVATSARSGSPKLIPLPRAEGTDLRALILTRAEDEPAAWTAPARVPAAPRATPADLMRELSLYRPDAPEAAPVLSEGESRAGLDAVLQGIAGDPDAGRQPVAVIYQDFLVRCRMRGLDGEALNLAAFRRRLGHARAGLDTAGPPPDPDGRWAEAERAAAALPDEVQGLFLLLARAALSHEACPGDEALARAIGSRSPGRARRLLSYIETRGTIVCRTDFGGNRIVALPGLGCETAPGDPKACVPEAGAPEWSLFAAE